MLDFKKYKIEMPWKTIKDFTTYNLYFEGRVVAHNISAEGLVDMKGFYPKAVREPIVDKDGYQAYTKEYYAEEARLIDLFWEDFAEEQGISTQHPKFKVLRQVAWDKGHYAGLSEVYSFACDLVPFLED